VSKKRTGRGGNESRNPRNNLVAQAEYAKKFGKKTKSCTGILHFDGPEIGIEGFIQSTGNSTFLQSRCALCNRLYFAVQQKPIKRLAAAIICAEGSGVFDWRNSCPESLRPSLDELVLGYFTTGTCSIEDCRYTAPHGSFRTAAAGLTKSLSGVERRPHDSTIVDYQTGTTYPAPQILHDLQSWAGRNGTLWDVLSTDVIWKWWVEFFYEDEAFCSVEESRQEKDADFVATPHPLEHFPWGAGNIKDTIQGHSVPAFNRVKASERIDKTGSSIGARPYGFLVEGDHLEMLRFSKKCKKKGESLGHSPAPLRWLGKNDPINGKCEPLRENIQKRDSLADLHKIAVVDPTKAATFVSWQIKDVVIDLGTRGVGPESFTQELQAAVERYFDELADDLIKTGGVLLRSHIKLADAGKTDAVYDYRFKKLEQWLTLRPAYKAGRATP